MFAEQNKGDSCFYIVHQVKILKKSSLSEYTMIFIRTLGERFRPS